MGVRVSGREVGWERMGELAGVLTGDLTGEAAAGWPAGLGDVVVVGLGTAGAGAATGEAAVTVGEREGAEGGPWRAA